MNVTRDFVSTEQREFKFKIGHVIASSLSGFLAGIVVASVFWMLMLFVR